MLLCTFHEISWNTRSWEFNSTLVTVTNIYHSGRIRCVIHMFLYANCILCQTLIPSFSPILVPATVLLSSRSKIVRFHTKLMVWTSWHNKPCRKRGKTFSSRQKKCQIHSSLTNWRYVRKVCANNIYFMPDRCYNIKLTCNFFQWWNRLHLPIICSKCPWWNQKTHSYLSLVIVKVQSAKKSLIQDTLNSRSEFYS